jgi:hypothetical protein
MAYTNLRELTTPGHREDNTAKRIPCPKETIQQLKKINYLAAEENKLSILLGAAIGAFAQVIQIRA